MKYVKVTSPDVNNGSGNRVTLWISGCSHNCKGCHNKWLHDYTKGKPLSEAEPEIYEALAKPYIKGITISGGDPLDQLNESLHELKMLLIKIKFDFPDKDIWIFSGFKLDELNDNQLDIVRNVDYFVDGKFVERLKSVKLPFRGSSNQTIWHNDDGNFSKVNDEIFKN